MKPIFSHAETAKDAKAEKETRLRPPINDPLDTGPTKDTIDKKDPPPNPLI